MIRIISFTEKGIKLSLKIKDSGYDRGRIECYSTKNIEAYNGLVNMGVSLKDWCSRYFHESDALIFIGACGIAVRTIAPHIVSKTSDPAVLVIDERGFHCISLLSGHLGGANEMALEISNIIGADPVITTASDVEEKVAIDVWARNNRLIISDMKKAKDVAADIVAGKKAGLVLDDDIEIEGPVPGEFVCMDHADLESDYIQVLVSAKNRNVGDRVLQLIPKNISVGIGCRKNQTIEAVKALFEEACQAAQIDKRSIFCISSIDIKEKEEALIELAKDLKVPFKTYSAQELNALSGEYKGSDFVKSITGVDCVCERAALMSLPENERQTDSLIVRKLAKDGVTLAIAVKKWRISFE